MNTPTYAFDYDAFLRLLLGRIRQAQTRSVVAVHRELVVLYWQIGNDILTRQAKQGWERRSLTGWRGISGTHSPK